VEKKMPQTIQLTTFNVNNLFLRYKFGRTFPGDMSGKSMVDDPKVGYLPLYKPGLFEVFDEEQRMLAASAIWDSAGQRWPDVLCLQEVESLLAARSFSETYLSNAYPHSLLIDGYDLRQIDVALLSRFPITHARSYVHELDRVADDNSRLFSRDCLEADILLPNQKTLTIYNNHFKSKLVTESNPDKKAAAQAAASAKRKRQAQRVMAIVRERFKGASFDKALFAVVGDFNDQPKSDTLKPLLARSSKLENVLERLPQEERWTDYYKGGNDVSQLDYLLTSPQLSKQIKGLPVVERAGIGFRAYSSKTGSSLPESIKLITSEEDEGILVPFAFDRYEGVTDKRAASDHCPITISFEI
jgi:endonuclease/exonuclease/phosphatase family metal-dependent hydrolase